MATVTLQRYTGIDEILRAIVAAAPALDLAFGPELLDDVGEVTLGHVRMPRPGDMRLDRRFVVGATRLALTCEPGTGMTRDGDEFDRSGYAIELRSPTARIEGRGLDSLSEIVYEGPDAVLDRILSALGEAHGPYPCATLPATPLAWNAHAIELRLGGPGMRVLLSDVVESRILVFPERDHAFGVIYASNQARVAPLGPMPSFDAPITQDLGSFEDTPLAWLDDVASLAGAIGLDRDELHARDDESFVITRASMGERRFTLDFLRHPDPTGPVRASYARTGDVHLRLARMDHENGRASSAFVVQDERGASLVSCLIGPDSPGRCGIRLRTHGRRTWTESLLRALPPIAAPW